MIIITIIKEEQVNSMSILIKYKVANVKNENCFNDI